jgi:hypothetical protein
MTLVSSVGPVLSLFESNKLDRFVVFGWRRQAIWFLNSSEAGDDQEKCELVHKLEKQCSFSSASSEEGESVLDELAAHRLLEFSNKPCTRYLSSFLGESTANVH